MKLTIMNILKLLTIFILVTCIFTNDAEKVKKKKKRSKLRAKMIKNLQAAENQDEKKVMVYRVLSYDSKLSLILMNAGLLPNTTQPDSVTNTNIINQLREFMHNFNDTASLQEARSQFDVSLTDGFKTLKEKYKFEYKNSTEPAPASSR